MKGVSGGIRFGFFKVSTLLGEEVIEFGKIDGEKFRRVPGVLDEEDLVPIDTGEDLDRRSFEADEFADIAPVPVVEFGDEDLRAFDIQDMFIILRPLDEGDVIRETPDLPDGVLVALGLHLPRADEVDGCFVGGKEEEFFSVVGKLNTLDILLGECPERIVVKIGVEKREFSAFGEDGDAILIIDDESHF